MKCARPSRFADIVASGTVNAAGARCSPEAISALMVAVSLASSRLVMLSGS